jgi:hypothetical protein
MENRDDDTHEVPFWEHNSQTDYLPILRATWMRVDGIYTERGGNYVTPMFEVLEQGDHWSGRWTWEADATVDERAWLEGRGIELIRKGGARR